MRIHTLIYSTVACMAIAVAALVAACTATPPSKPIVTVSIEPQRYMLEQLGGDRIQVRSLLTEGANPETYDPSVTHMHNLGNSLGYLCMGHIGFEAALVDKIHEANPQLKIFNTSQGIVPITGTHSHGSHEHHTVDPHTWSSVKNAKIIVTNMLAALKEIDPDGANYYTANYTAFMARLDSLDSAFTTRLAPVKGKPFMVWHPSLSYFARDYGLEQVVLGNSEAKESSIESLRTSVDKARSRGAAVFFYQKDYDSRQASVLNDQLHATQVSVNPLAYEWADEMSKIAGALGQ